MLQIKDPDFSISSRGDHSAVATVWHELDREDVLRVSSSNGASQLKLLAFAGRLVRVNVQMLIVRARGQKSARFRPTQRIYATGMAVKLIDNVEVRDERGIAVELSV
jgi:hypothetical protein